MKTKYFVRFMFTYVFAYVISRVCLFMLHMCFIFENKVKIKTNCTKINIENSYLTYVFVIKVRCRKKIQKYFLNMYMHVTRKDKY